MLAHKRAEGNRQVQKNPIFEEIKAKAKAALDCETKLRIYAQRKIDVESVNQGPSVVRQIFTPCVDLKKSIQSLGL